MHPPILYQRERSREKVSIIAALSLSPRRRRVGLYFSLRPNVTVTTAWLIAFLAKVAQHLRHPLLTV